MASAVQKPAETRQKNISGFLGGRVDRSTIMSHRQTPRSTNAIPTRRKWPYSAGGSVHRPFSSESASPYIVRRTMTPGRGGVGCTSGAPAGVVPEVGITPGTATRPVARGGDAPRAARPQGQPEVPPHQDFFGKTEPKTAKSLTQHSKVSQKRPTTTKTDIFSFSAGPIAGPRD